MKNRTKLGCKLMAMVILGSSNNLRIVLGMDYLWDLVNNEKKPLLLWSYNN